MSIRTPRMVKVMGGWPAVLIQTGVSIGLLLAAFSFFVSGEWVLSILLTATVVVGDAGIIRIAKSISNYG